MKKGEVFYSCFTLRPSSFRAVPRFSPGFAVLAVLALALAIGVNVAISGVAMTIPFSLSCSRPIKGEGPQKPPSCDEGAQPIEQSLDLHNQNRPIAIDESASATDRASTGSLEKPSRSRGKSHNLFKRDDRNRLSRVVVKYLSRLPDFYRNLDNSRLRPGPRLATISKKISYDK